MAGGVRYKFQGSQIQVLTDYDANSPSIAISNISKTNPAVLTYSGSVDPAEGSVVKIFGVGGMTEVNGNVFVVDNPNSGANTFELFGIDATAYGSFTSGGHFDIATFSNFCELTNYNRQGGTSPEIPATTVCSTATEYEIGLPDFGTTQMDFNFAPGTAVQTALHTFHISGDIMAVKIILPNSGGNLVQLGFMQQESETAGVGGLWTASATIRNTGERFDY